ncbi:hypothetical protein C2I18_00450 [Paenibacillus sp. PK3_47]|uniref:iron-sulfur cluster biosynthesis family protein n=1 Tax=Paenibacillus sp. PK3_47 TaxID=2072642 RepID=UPI00201E3697|nr:iron-sulfur cluster biosynthesis family protein [Paenibacillus sp. PK3_47]UQZ32153.1 hypothetical protein C2I18_00450 [Paenibacillus sp. PK3_47]
MHIRLTPLAERKLTEKLDGRPGLFRLFFDTESCGCDGITVLLIVDEAAPGDIPVETGSLPFVVSGQQEIFYEEHMRLDSEEHYSSFKLDSDSQIYSRNIQVRDIRGSGASSAPSSASCSISAR